MRHPRALFTDDEESVLEAMRAVVLNGIDDLVSRPNLGDRALVLSLPAIPEERKDTHRALARKRSVDPQRLAPEHPRREGWVFCRPDGCQRRKGDDAGWSDKKYKIKGEGRVKPGLKIRAGIARHARFHDLRHYAESRIMPTEADKPSILLGALDRRSA